MIKRRPRTRPDRKTSQPIWVKELGLAALSGVLLILIFPRFGLDILAWIALVPLFYVLWGQRGAKSLWLGWLTGFIFYGGTLYWITNSMIDYGHIPGWLSYLILFLLVGYLGLYLGLFGLLLNYLAGDRLGLWITLSPLLWCSLEVARTHLLTGFPWAILGYSQFRQIDIIQIADHTGVYGLSFLLVWTNAIVAGFLVGWQGKGTLPRGYLYMPLGLAICLGLCLYYGRWTVANSRYSRGDKIRIALIQGNIEQDEKWDPSYQEAIIDIYRRLTLTAITRGPQLIVWPESATPFYFPSQVKYSLELYRLAKEARCYLLFGSPAYKLDKGGIKMFNRAYLLSPEGEIVDYYDKIHLVPFGEYVPLKRFLPFVQKMVQGIGDFYAGQRYTVFQFPQGRFSVLICFEVIFPQLVRQFVKKGAQFFANLTNDAWFGDSAGPYQHLSMVTFRAIENRVYIVRAANTGISAIIDPWGRIRQPSELFTRTFVIDYISPKDERFLTFYTKYGDIFAYVCCILVFSLLGKRVLKVGEEPAYN